MVAVPALYAVTTPVIMPTSATTGLLLLHNPPMVVVLSVDVVCAQITVGPVIAAGEGFTVTIAVAAQPSVDVYDMIVVPPATPVTTPVVAPTVATDVALLLQVPPGVASLSVVVCPEHTSSVPVMADGNALTVTTRMAKHPAPVVYVIVAVPGAMPLTIPVDKPTEATEGVVLVQVPPETVLVSVVVVATHSEAVPPIADGVALTVTIAVREQPETVYDIVAVPAVMPETTPVPDITDATPGLPDDHAPEGVASARVVVLPMQTERIPVIAAGTALTVTVAVVVQPALVVYVMIEVPAPMPVTIPDEAPTVATAVVPLTHVPPGDALLSVVVDPAQTDSVPVIAGGAGLTVTTVVRTHPGVLVYEIVAVPAATPVSMPVVSPMVAMPGAAEAHVPPVVGSESVLVPPTQTTVVPVMGGGVQIDQR